MLEWLSGMTRNLVGFALGGLILLFTFLLLGPIFLLEWMEFVKIMEELHFLMKGPLMHLFLFVTYLVSSS